MDRKTFLRVLAEELGNFPQETREDILADFGDHFDMALESGKTEEEICRLLGAPSDIAEQYISDYREYGGGDEADSEPIRRPRIAPEARTGKREYSFDGAGLTDIEAELRSADVEVRPSEGGELRVVVTGGNDEHWVDFDGRRLTIQEKQRVFGFEISFKRKKFLIMVPVAVDRARFKINGGDVDICRVEIHDAEIKTDGGDITLEMVTSKTLKTTTGGGDVEFKELTADRAEIKTGGGDIELKRVTIGGVELTTGGGDIELNDVDAGSLTVKTGGGEVKIKGQGGSIKATTGGGNIKCGVSELTGGSSFSTGGGNISLSAGKLTDDAELSAAGGNITLHVNQFEGDATLNARFGNVTAEIGGESRVNVVVHSKKIANVKQTLESFPDSDYRLQIEPCDGTVTVRPI